MGYRREEIEVVILDIGISIQQTVHHTQNDRVIKILSHYTHITNILLKAMASKVWFLIKKSQVWLLRRQRSCMCGWLLELVVGPPVFVVQRLWCSVVQNANLGQTQLFRSAPIFKVYNVPAVYLHHKNVPAPQKMHYKIGLS